MTAPDLVSVKRALISVSDKAGLVDLGKSLTGRGVEILSTGGSAKALAEAGVPVKEVSEQTGFPEIMDGRVKTLHPTIHGGLLARRDIDEHVSAMDDHGIEPIDLLICNLYPFEQTLASGAAFEDCVENIDIGGPAMIRAASKNHDFVTVIVDNEDYEALLGELDANDGATSLAFRRRQSAIAYARTAAYDSAISNWLADEVGEGFPRRVTFSGSAPQVMRYGENPHQQAAFYHSPDDTRTGVATASQIQGKELSYNNMNDTDAAFELVSEFDEPAIAIIKHANPCGVALDERLVDAYHRAFACDSVSAFGGIIAANRPLDGETAEEIVKILTEVVIAPGADADARRILGAKKNLRLLLTDGIPDPGAAGIVIKALAGGFLLQERDSGRVDKRDLQVVTKRAPDARELRDMMIAFRICKHVKSNGIVYVKDGATVGIGAGQMSRVDSARIAALKAVEAAEEVGATEPGTVGSAVASDAFFPFADGLITTAEAGATAVIQPGGSLRDDEVIAAADEKGLAMVFTGMRHFRH
ncbi:MAG: bifunctional phosphoribosylaminoimidazolecarboxamide formyltransferase/IMP cyclohydrolase [Rhodospirillaceae bacterium]|nr:bifunctional phosphoribosylaminoimidazolecarboxamide formyltransferase/IMP cyclohydrolase [Rhodospirillaceae bacterium]MBT6136803.1 bifunctional phosphoribosylaminoimidazolecarboxamide formyltransferase/IMP cyclohydrolase [Rhodospirillaceae bacterium]